MPAKAIDRTGERIGMLIVTGYTSRKLPRSVNGLVMDKSERFAICLCDCGTVKEIDVKNLGKTSFGCGCRRGKWKRKKQD